MSAEESGFEGKFSFALAPYWKWFLERWSQPDVKKGVARKPAQVGWTQSVVCNVLGYTAHANPKSCITMFPKDGSARNFDLEKFSPMISSTPALRAAIPAKSRAKGNKTLFKKFPGGFIKFVGSNSIADVKSTSAKLLIVEEPDDCNLNLRGQGDAIKLIEERGKTYRDLKMLIGGTPSVKGVSSIDDEMLYSDRNRWLVPCPDCGEFQPLEWEQVRWDKDGAADEHPVWGRQRPETAVYVCAACGSCWDDQAKNLAIQRGHAEPQAPFRGVLGLDLNELYACWHQSRMEVLVQRFLAAEHEAEGGNIEAKIVFWNACLGRSWEFKNAAGDVESLEERGEDYQPNTVPARGLVLTMGVDVQHNRLAVIIRAWGRGSESWLVLFDEIEGNCIDKTDPVWDKLDDVLFADYAHAMGVPLRIRACTIDSGDGTAAETVYAYVRSRQHRGVRVMPGKGSSKDDADIFRRETTSKDSNAANTKAAKYGLRVYQVGVSKAKDLLLGDKGPGRLSLTGDGPGRFHWYKDVRADYLKQLTAEVKIPLRGQRGKKIWTLKSGQRNEALDAENYALHAAHALKVHIARDAEWSALEARMRQQRLFGNVIDTAAIETPDIESSAQPVSEAVPPAAVDKPRESLSTAGAEPAKTPVQTSALKPAAQPARPPVRPPQPRRSNWVNAFRN